MPDVFDFGTGYTVEYEPDPDDDYPYGLYCGDEKIAAYATGEAAIDDLDCYPDDIVPPERWAEFWDWARADMA